MYEKKILFIDDDESQRQMINDIIKRFGYAVKTAADSGEAMQILESEKYSLIIMDLNMPGVDGMALCKRIRKTDSKSVIYALSGHAAEFKPERFEEIGFNGYLFKPVKIKVLKMAIKGAFERAAIRKEEATL
ncbi:hypothetical protein BuS5_01685 [Desulfosarcina sp. BuS5]|uniref:response regulator n=1 Tax=Desulfosarcina sp. BuS5 TaxID=933262 RepID=UPI0004875A3F|nr:response regulator [Desulfosarcina sp. BuS5]WDN88717.1 hypothetical protein BuS5_01685 [Desulfosarcina sp. BuS5]